MRVDRQRYPDRHLPATQLSGAWKKNHMRLLIRGTNIGTLSYSNTIMMLVRENVTDYEVTSPNVDLSEAKSLLTKFLRVKARTPRR